MISFILEELGLNEVPTVSYTGMASCVLKSKGNEYAQTIHSLIYNTSIAKDPKTGKEVFFHKLKEKEELSDYKLIVVDEYSMVPMNLVNDLLSFEIPILFTGDRAQLSAIGKQNTLEEDYFLDEPLRQALDNPIIYLATLARTGRINEIKIGSYGEDVNVYRWSDFPIECMEKADQIIVCKNATVTDVNTFYRREILNLPAQSNKQILNNDKVMIIEKNNWGKTNSDGFAAVNGLIGYAENVSYSNKYDIYKMDLNPALPTSKFYNLFVDKAKFEGRNVSKIVELMRNDYTNKGENQINSMIHAYAITTHKSQGSEWDRVLFGPEFLRKDIITNLWYTGITRAKKKLDILI